MKTILFIILFFSLAIGYSQPVKFQCLCSKIGIDSSWADYSKISCYLLPGQRNASDKSKGVFNLVVVMAPATQNSGMDPLLYLHGGPAIATLENVPRYLETET